MNQSSTKSSDRIALIAALAAALFMLILIPVAFLALATSSGDPLFGADGPLLFTILFTGLLVSAIQLIRWGSAGAHLVPVPRLEGSQVHGPGVIRPTVFLIMLFGLVGAQWCLSTFSLGEHLGDCVAYLVFGSALMWWFAAPLALTVWVGSAAERGIVCERKARHLAAALSVWWPLSTAIVCVTVLARGLPLNTLVLVGCAGAVLGFQIPLARYFGEMCLKQRLFPTILPTREAVRSATRRMVTVSTLSACTLLVAAFLAA